MLDFVQQSSWVAGICQISWRIKGNMPYIGYLRKWVVPSVFLCCDFYTSLFLALVRGCLIAFGSLVFIPVLIWFYWLGLDFPWETGVSFVGLPIRRACLCGIVFIAGWCRMAQHTVGDTVPAEIVLGCIRKRAWHESKSEPASSVPLEFLLQVPALNSCVGFPSWQINTWEGKMTPTLSPQVDFRESVLLKEQKAH